MCVGTNQNEEGTTTSSSSNSNTTTTTTDTPQYYKFDYGKLPDELFHVDVPAEKWLDRCESTTNTNGFPPNSFQHLDDIPLDVELERIFGIPLYMLGNVFPFLIVPFIVLYIYGGIYMQRFILFVLLYLVTLSCICTFIFQPHFLKKYKQHQSLRFNQCSKDSNNVRANQYAYTERNSGKYLSMKFVWPKSLHPPNLYNTIKTTTTTTTTSSSAGTSTSTSTNSSSNETPPIIFCIVPHGVGPFGITAYPLWSKLWNDKVCHWTAAPAVMQIPIIGYFLKQIGYIPAKSSSIVKTLVEKKENVGLTLDGIDGMFQQSSTQEIAVLNQRKGIIKIALKTSVPIVPVYGFGHTDLWTVVVDPWGIMEYLSNAMGISLTPFFGRFGWILGPPRRVPITVCLGDPIVCPQTESPTQKQIDQYHAKMLEGYTKIFETHKNAYGWSHKTLKFV